MEWVLVVVGGWVLCAVAVALLIGRGMRAAERREELAWPGKEPEPDRGTHRSPPDRRARPGGGAIRFCGDPVERRAGRRRDARRR